MWEDLMNIKLKIMWREIFVNKCGVVFQDLPRCIEEKHKEPEPE
jgi:hypothetical protein